MRASNFGERQLAGLDFTRLKTILVATDLSVRENAAVQRARQLALAHGARLKLMYMPPHGKEVPTGATQRLANLACQLEESGELRVGLVPVRCNEVDDLLEQAASVDLVVLPHRRARSTAAFFRGQPVLRVLRGAGCPVLVTRKAGDAYYQRILVGVDFSPESQVLVKFATHLDVRASVQLFHAIDTADEAKLRAADVTLQAVQAYRERAINDAWGSMHAFTDLLQARTRQLLAAVGRGEAGLEIVKQQQRSGAELVVVGKTGSSAWTDFLFGSVAHRVLSWGSSDVLVVPLRKIRPTPARQVREPVERTVVAARQRLGASHERA